MPWNSIQDINLRNGAIRGIIAYDPEQNPLTIISDYYPRQAINRPENMFLVKDGTVIINPQVKLTEVWNVTLNDVIDLKSTDKYILKEVKYYNDPLKDTFSYNVSINVFLDTYQPIWGYIAPGYGDHFYSLDIRSVDNANFSPGSTYTQPYPDDYVIKNASGNLLLGMLKITDRNQRQVVRLITSGVSGNAEVFDELNLGAQVVRGQKTRIYAPDFRAYLDIYPDSLVSNNETFITITPKRFDPAEITLQEGMSLPYGPVYSLKPQGLKFNPEYRPVLTSLIYNVDTEDIELTRLVAYHLDNHNQLLIAPMVFVRDENNDLILEQGEKIGRAHV
jgi:hypothetical protein